MDGFRNNAIEVNVYTLYGFKLFLSLKKKKNYVATIGWFVFEWFQLSNDSYSSDFNNRMIVRSFEFI